MLSYVFTSLISISVSPSFLSFFVQLFFALSLAVPLLVISAACPQTDVLFGNLLLVRLKRTQSHFHMNTLGTYLSYAIHAHTSPPVKQVAEGN